MENTDNVVDIRNYFTKNSQPMEPIQEQVKEPETDQIGFGVPVCPCGKCINNLINEHGSILISMDSLKDWFKGICPKAA